MEHLSPKDTAHFLHANPQALLIDCRSDREFRFVGHPIGARHVAWQSESGWEINPDFLSEVEKLAAANRELPLAVICRTGERAVEASKALEAAGFSRVFAVRHGFEGDVGANFQRGGVNGWRFDGLPWETSLCGKCGG